MIVAADVDSFVEVLREGKRMLKAVQDVVTAVRERPRGFLRERGRAEGALKRFAGRMSARPVIAPTGVRVRELPVAIEKLL